MATIKKRGNSFLFRCYDGYDVSGRQIERTMTWKVPDGMTDKRAEKEALHEAALFEERVRTGHIAEGKTKFSDFAKRWFSDYAEAQLRQRTIARYKELMQRIEPAIGHIYLDKLRPAHLISFYKELTNTPKATSYSIQMNFKQYLSDNGITQIALCESTNLSISVVRALIQGKNVSATNAQKVSAALNQPMNIMFQPAGDGKKLSGKTVLHYHRLISSMLHTAVEWQLIPENPADRVKPPKVQKHEAEYLDEKQAIHLLELLSDAPIIYRTAVEVLLFTGMRRGELLGLEWSDIDFDNNTISITRSSLYLTGKGIFEDDTKNRSSHRVIKAPASAMNCLAQYKKWQMQKRLMLGSAWKNCNRVFTAFDGAPMHPDTLSGWFHDFIKHTDLPQIHIHSLRHTNATLQIANGVSVTTVAGNLGHANASTTTKIYAHTIQSAVAASAEIMDHLLNPHQRQA